MLLRYIKDEFMKKYRYDETGALTVEASIILPLFMIIIITFIYFMQVYYVYGNVNMAMYNAGILLSVKAGVDESISGEDIHREIRGNLSNNILDRSCIRNGLKGIDNGGSCYDINNDDICMQSKYSIAIPFRIIGINNYKINQDITVRGWTGDKSLITHKNFVYKTKTGSVYHTDIQCTYLMIKKIPILRKDIDNYRNDSGAKYYPCKECDNCKQGEYVYITKYGTSYHNVALCSAIRRTVIPIDIHELKGMKKCAKCCK